MDKKIMVQKAYYSSSDWHDWKAWDEMLINDNTTGTPVFFDTIEEATEAIIKDFTDDNDFLKQFNIKDEVLTKGKFLANDDNDCDISLEKTDYGFKASFVFYFNTYTYYDIKTVDPAKVKYLPIRQLLCFPKKSPNEDERETDYFNTWQEACRYKASMKDLKDRRGYLHEFHTVIADDNWDINPWYNKEWEN